MPEYKKAEVRLEAKEEQSADGSGDRQMVARAGAMVQTGPLPPAEELAKFHAVSPAIALDIVEMAKSAQRHEQAMETKKVEAGAILEKRGQIVGATILLGCLGAGTFLLQSGHWFGVLPLITAVLAAFGAASRNKKDEKASAEPLPPATGRELPQGGADREDQSQAQPKRRQGPRKRRGR